MTSEFYDTIDFEIYSFCHFQINLDNNSDNSTRNKSKKSNNDKYIDNSEIVISVGDDVKKNNEDNIIEYFLASGININTKKLIMILYKLIFNNKLYKIQFEEIQKLELNNIESNDGPFTNIIQAKNKNNNNIFITNQGEKIHLFQYIFK